jgi:hypothetical protein
LKLALEDGNLLSKSEEFKSYGTSTADELGDRDQH